MTPVRTDRDEWLARMERLIEEYRAAKDLDLLNRALKSHRLGRELEDTTDLDTPPRRMH